MSEKLNPQLVPTDFNKPGINGLGFVRLLRRNPRFDRTPIFVVSTETDAVKRERLELAGATRWPSKPI